MNVSKQEKIFKKLNRSITKKGKEQIIFIKYVLRDGVQ